VGTVGGRKALHITRCRSHPRSAGPTLGDRFHLSDTPDPAVQPDPEDAQPDDEGSASADSTSGRSRRRIDPLSLAAITAVSLAVAILITLVIVQVFGTTEDDAVQVSDALDLEAPEEGAASTLAVGEPAPDVQFDLLGGGTSSMSQMIGTPVVLNFWSSTCAPCLAEMPDFESVHQSLGGDVDFLGVDVTDTEDAGVKMVEQTGVTYPNARDPQAEILAAFGGIALPRTVLIDAEGVVVDIHNGPLDAEELTTALREAGMTS
jgi:cytochrome c biogenesis protein CcmG/thiol:disulfide interchange protein DsbE